MTIKKNAFASKLNLMKAEKIRARAAAGETLAVLAEDHDVSVSSIKSILEYRSYRPEGMVRLDGVTVTQAKYDGLVKKAEAAKMTVNQYVAKLWAKALASEVVK